MNFNKKFLFLIALVFIASVGIVAAEDATGLPVDTWSLTGYSVEEYQQQLADVVSGAIAIDDQVIEGDGITGVELSNVNLHYE